jgi:hypothetical protein
MFIEGIIEGIETYDALKELQTTNINERAKYTANTGMAQISVANSNLNGTGTLYSIISGASNGTLIKTITIKATASDSIGMIRLYINTNIIDEIEIPSVTQSAIEKTFSIAFDVNYNLQNGDVLMASTQNANTFNIIAEGLDWAY